MRKDQSLLVALVGVVLMIVSSDVNAQEALPARTTLSRSDAVYTIPETGYAVLKRGPIEAVIVDNRAVDDAVLPKHRAGYHGVASLKHRDLDFNLFVPSYSGLNFEHIHDGTTLASNILFEPRQAPMQLRKINDYTAELYQHPTPHWGLESCLRYELLESGAIEVTFECIPRRDTFKNGYIGLFWASYIDAPANLGIHYPGKPKGAAASANSEWIRGVSPKHGELSTHLSVGDRREFKHDPDFPLKLVFSESASNYTAPWYFGQSGRKVFLQTFRAQDGVRFSQSPSGGGGGNPAWDFQWFVPDYKVGQRYQLVMRASYFTTVGLDELQIQDRAVNVARAAQLGLGDKVAVATEHFPLRSAWDKLQKGGRIVCLGDSVTGVYYHTGGQRAYTDMLGLALQKSAPLANFKMINAGISGNTTVNGLERLDRDVLSQKPDLVTVMFGLNDMTRIPPEQYRANLMTIIRRCWETGSDVLLSTPNNVINTGGRPSKKLEEYCEIIRDVGRTLSVPVADCYAQMEVLRAKDPIAWRLLLSDEIHPNLDGHKRMGEILAQAISGKTVGLDDVQPPLPSMGRIAESVKAGRVVKVLAMTPLDLEIKTLLLKQFPTAKLEIVTWNVADRSLAQLEQEAKDKVRALRPDLVILGVPRTAKFNSHEEFVRSYSWIMNWSLSFGTREWECVVVHPSVTDPDHPDPEHDGLVRQLVRAQDLTLVDRKAGDSRTVAELLSEVIRP
ncbi:MAG: lysophospholipase L1-like esterase [Planctomycetaceae bacterium]|nr:lysophospholipase L1-like esterase [Planctomycetaceae bacterium]